MYIVLYLMILIMLYKNNFHVIKHKVDMQSNSRPELRLQDTSQYKVAADFSYTELDRVHVRLSGYNSSVSTIE